MKTITVELRLSIGLNGAHEDTAEIEVEDNWEEIPAETREKVLHEYWLEWAWNYIDGFCAEVQ